MSRTDEATAFEVRWFAYADLGQDALYACLKLRTDVFIVEQNCPYPDIDGKDDQARHLMLVDGANGRLAGYLRLFAPEGGTDSEEWCGEDAAARIGRVVVAADYRGQALGKRLIREALSEAFRHWPKCKIRLSAQAHLTDFYGNFGFVSDSDVYLEDDIPHIEMVLEPED